MQRLNGTDDRLPQATGDVSDRGIRQLVTPRDVAQKLGVSVAWVTSHASGKTRPFLPAVKLGPGRGPVRFDPKDIEEFIDECRRMLRERAQGGR